MKEPIFEYAVDAFSASECVDSIMSAIDQNQKCAWLACLNPHSYVVSLKDPVFALALKNADWLIPDGAGIALASQIWGGTIRQRVTGSDIFYALLKNINESGGRRIFFLGASDETLKFIRERMMNDYPNIHLAGVYSPPFKPSYSPSENDAMIEAINASSADVLWVGMTAPKQEKWIYENHSRLNVKFAGAIGAVFDFYGGRVKRSHPVFCKLGLEWLPRFIQQPRRLWRRNFISTPIFVFMVFCEFFRRILRTPLNRNS